MRKKYQKRVVSQKCTQAIIFARVSSKRQKEEGISLKVQEEETVKYCKDTGLKVIATYSIDESSTHGDRKVFHEMINFAAGCEDKVAIVVAYVDRLQRLPEDSYYVESLRRSGKVEVHFIKERLIITKDSAASDLTFWNMFVMFANAQVNSQTDKVKEDNLLDFYLEGKLPQSTYENKKAAIDKEIEELKASAEKYKTIDNDMKKAVEKVISMAVKISNIFDKATPDKQNQLLRLLLTDCKLNGKRLEYKLKAPFDRLIACKNYQDWPQVAVENLGEFEKVTV